QTAVAGFSSLVVHLPAGPPPPVSRLLRAVLRRPLDAPTFEVRIERSLRSGRPAAVASGRASATRSAMALSRREARLSVNGRRAASARARARSVRAGGGGSRVGSGWGAALRPIGRSTARSGSGLTP